MRDVRDELTPEFLEFRELADPHPLSIIRNF